MRRAALALAFAALSTLAACKQGEGERCQVTSDCDDGLTCAAATLTCVTNDNQEKPIDAVPVPDGHPIVLDAPLDAHPDAAAPDAPPDAP